VSPLAANRVRVLTIMGTRVRVSVRGTGTPLLLIMGIGGSLDMWQPLERSLTPLGYQTISFDLPGSGASPAVFPPRRMPGLARIALGVLDALDIEQADLLGVSFGGIVAQEVARIEDTRVRRVVLAATGPGLGGIPAHPRVLAHMSTPLRYWSPRYAQRIGPLIYGGAARRDDGLHGRMSARFERPPSLLGTPASSMRSPGGPPFPGCTGFASRCWCCTATTTRSPRFRMPVCSPGCCRTRGSSCSKAPGICSCWTSRNWRLATSTTFCRRECPAASDRGSVHGCAPPVSPRRSLS